MNVSRRGFLAGSALTAGLFGLAGCSSNGAAGTSTADPLAAPAVDKYPIEPDKEGTEAKWSSEEVRDGWTRVTNQDGGATIGVASTARIIQVDGYAFRDMDGDGKLSLFEDWRQSADDRAADLASQLTGEECIQLMWHGGVQGTPDSPGVAADANDTSLLDKGSCAGVSRLGGDGDSYATVIKWINDIQTKCEARPHGIPTSAPRTRTPRWAFPPPSAWPPPWTRTSGARRACGLAVPGAPSASAASLAPRSTSTPTRRSPA